MNIPPPSQPNPQPDSSNSPLYVRRRVITSRSIREQLRVLLGGKCARCPQTEHLQFDCKVSQGGDHHALNWRQRLNFYVEQAKLENLQLLCPKCHVEKTLDEIATRRFFNFQLACPHCKGTVRVKDALTSQPPLPVEDTGDEANHVILPSKPAQNRTRSLT